MTVALDRTGSSNFTKVQVDQSSNIWKFSFFQNFDLDIFVLFAPNQASLNDFCDVTDPDTSHLIFEYDSRDIK